MGKLVDPHEVTYLNIDAVTSEDGSTVELVETPSCWGGAYWAMAHMGQGELVQDVEHRGGQVRYVLHPGTDESPLEPSSMTLGISRVEVDENEVMITYRGLGGAGMGATSTRAGAAGVLRADLEEAGGRKEARGTITLPRRQRVLVALDDTDSPTKGATWSLAYNIGKCLECENHRFLGHSIVQLYPVAERTQNCTATVIEFGSIRPEGLAEQVATITGIHSLSKNWGVASWNGFEPSPLKDYSNRCRDKAVTIEDCLEAGCNNNVNLWGGRGRIGALAALAWFDRPCKAVMR